MKSRIFKKVQSVLLALIMIASIVMMMPVYAADANDSFERATGISVNSTISDNLVASSDRNYYKFTISKAGYVSLRFDHEYIDSGDSHWDVTLYNADKTVLITRWFSGNVTKNQTAKTGIPAGQYYVVVREGYVFSDLNYSLQVNYTSASNWETEVNNSFETADSIAVNSAINGTLASSDDADYYTFTIPQDGYVSLTVKHGYVDNGDTFWNAILFNPEFAELINRGFAGNKATNETAHIGVPAGKYYVLITPYYHSDLDYSLQVNYTSASNWETEVNNSFETADGIAVNSAINGSLFSSDDADYYTFTIPQDGYVSLTVKHGYVDNGDTFWNAILFNPEFAELINRGFVGNKTTDETARVGVPAGKYYVLITPYYHSDLDYSLQVNYTSASNWETEVNNSFETADSIANNVNVYGTLTGDNNADYFKFEISQNDSVSFTFCRDALNDGESYWHMCLYNSRKAELAAYDFTGNEIATTTEGINLSAGTYYLKITDAYCYTDAVYYFKVNAKTSTHVHSYTSSRTKEPTCAENGVITYTCACGDSYTVSIPKLSHTWNNGAVTTAATCTATGVRTFTCTACGATRTENIDKIPHSFGEWVTVKEPTDTQDGLRERTCIYGCGTKDSEPIPRLQNGTISVAAPKAYIGKTVDVQIKLQNNPGLIATRLEIGYDSAALKLVGVKNGSVITNGSFVTSQTYTTNPYVILWNDSMATSDYTADGVLATLTFEVLETAAPGFSEITVSYDPEATFNNVLQNKTMTVQSGRMEIIKRVIGDADDDGVLNLKDVVVLRRFLAGWEGYSINEANADVDGDGQVTLKDGVLIERYLAGWDVTLI